MSIDAYQRNGARAALPSRYSDSVPDAGGVPAGDRGLIEEAVKLLLSAAPPGWTQLHGEFEPSSRPLVAVVSVSMQQGGLQPLDVSPEVVTVLAKQQQSAAAVGAPWRRLVIDCHADGRLSACAEGDPVGLATQRPPDPQRVPRRLLAALTAGCLIAAAVVFAVGWRWLPPPRAEMVPPPPPPPRQQEAFDVLSKWFDAMNHANVAGMRAVSCLNPRPAIIAWFKSEERYGETQAYTYPEAVTSVVQHDTQYTVVIAVREHPLDAEMRSAVEEQQKNGGFAFYHYVLADEGGKLKVCDELAEAPR